MSYSCQRNHHAVIHYPLDRVYSAFVAKALGVVAPTTVGLFIVGDESDSELSVQGYSCVVTRFWNTRKAFLHLSLSNIQNQIHLNIAISSNA